MASRSFSKKPRFNLSLVVHETGVKADTLRAWERRYQMPQPSRTEGGHRLYSEHDIQAIKWLQQRLDEGMRISQAVDYWHDLIAAGNDPLEKATPASEKAPLGSEIGGQSLAELGERWIEHVLEFDEIRADQILSQAFAQFPIEIVCTELIHTSLSEIGRLWYEGEATVQQEHFASELATRKLQALVTSAPLPHHDQKVLLACPPGEFHFISLLMLNLMLRYRGWDVLYLGSNVPNIRLTETITDTHPDLAVFSASRLPSVASLVKTVQMLKEFQIPSAYSGWIFSENQRLPNLVPAHYLGQDLHESILMIEDLLENPRFSLVEAPLPLLETRTEFEDKVNLLEYRLLEILNGGADGLFHAGDLAEVNQHLADDIMAALELGDITLLGLELDWVKGLLSYRDLPDGLFKEYTKAYYSAAQQVLGEKSETILSWLEAVVQNLED